jgi:hypothetical protein
MSDGFTRPNAVDGPTDETLAQAAARDQAGSTSLRLLTVLDVPFQRACAR